MEWTLLLNRSIEIGEFLGFFRYVYGPTNHSKLRSFQYRLLLYGVVTNTYAYQNKIINSDLCTFCNATVETILHLFYECNIVINFWHGVVNIVNEFVPFDTINKEDFYVENTLFNNVRDNTMHVINFLILVAKYSKDIKGEVC